MSEKKKILLLFPTPWDAKQLEACRDAWSARYEVVYDGPPDEQRDWDFDELGFLEQAVERWRGRIEGVASSSDYPGATLAGALAERLGLPGTPPGRVIGASHKYRSRELQRQAVPEATPPFWLVDPARPDDSAARLTYPCFVKPVKGAFSIMARRVDSAAELVAFLKRPAAAEFVGRYMAPFNRLVAHFTELEVNGSYFLAEALLHGRLVTVDGYAAGGAVEVLGVVDSVVHPETGSFLRFDFPSSLPPEVERRMAELTRRLIPALGFTDCAFNIEMIHDARSGSVHVIEVNPRIAGQFGDLHRAVHGTSSYEALLAIAAGDAPHLRRRGAGRVASSRPLRLFRPSLVRRAPDAEAVKAVEAEFPGTLVWIECATGDRLANFERLEDGFSLRYAIVNTSAESRAALDARLDAIVERLGFEFETL